MKWMTYTLVVMANR